MRLRPHHLLCLFAYRGQGYNRAFIQRMDALQQAYLEGEAATIETAFDDVCAACPYNGGDRCANPEGAPPERIDRAIAGALGLAEGAAITATEVRARLAALAPEAKDALCEGCSWKEAGSCKEKWG
ncbi:MAG: DUF1284 domain-containing protein [Myxococcales bacterium]|nr:MAG: DUF1284 domain-containing protein [Myxococcales bacterium]